MFWQFKLRNPALSVQVQHAKHVLASSSFEAGRTFVSLLAGCISRPRSAPSAVVQNILGGSPPEAALSSTSWQPERNKRSLGGAFGGGTCNMIFWGKKQNGRLFGELMKSRMGYKVS